MSRISSVTLGILVLSALLASEASAQWNAARFNAGCNRLYTTVGLDPALVTSVGYARVVPLLGRNFQLGGELGIVTAHFDTRDYRARLEVQSSILKWRSLGLLGSATFITRGTDNSIYSALNFGSDFTGTAGFYRPGWFAAGQFGFDKAIVTHLTNSDWYRDNYYADAKDGWYLTGGGTFHYGLAAGVTLGKAELVGRFGLHRTENFEDLNPPMYASLGLGFGL